MSDVARKMTSLTVCFDDQGEPTEIHAVEKFEMGDVPGVVATRRSQLVAADHLEEEEEALVVELVKRLRGASDRFHAAKPQKK